MSQCGVVTCHARKALVLCPEFCPEQTNCTPHLQMNIDQDLTLAAGKDKGTKLPGLPLMIPDVSAGVDAFEFSISNGVMIDWSLRGEAVLVCINCASWLMRKRPCSCAKPHDQVDFLGRMSECDVGTAPLHT